MNSRSEKNNKIAETLKRTTQRRSNMQIFTRTLKIDESHFSKEQKDILERMFLEAKWLRNSYIANGETQHYINKTEVDVKLPDGTLETRQIKALAAQVKQSVHQQIKDDLKGLKSSKEKGRKVGKLKFVSEVKSLNLKQPGKTYKFVNENNTRMKIQKLPGTIRVNGYEQLEEAAEFGNAKLVKRALGYYIIVTCYKHPEEKIPVDKPFDKLGVDFGIATSFTFSNGDTANLYFEEPDRLKTLQKKLSRQQKGSNGYKETVHLIECEYEKLSNRKNDCANKFMSFIMSQTDFLYYQDEMISNWQKGLFGKKIHHDIQGRMKKLFTRNDNCVMIDRSLPTTQLCVCGVLNKHSLDKRTYFCPSCGHICDRDEHSSVNMIRFGENNIEYSSPVCGLHTVTGGETVRRDIRYSSGVMQVSVKPEASRS